MKKSKVLIFLVLLLSNVVCFAQAPGFDDDVEDVPGAPINQWVYLVMLAGVFYGFKRIMNTIKKSNSQKA